MAEVFKPIFSEFWLTLFIWLFTILAIGFVIWFILYIKNSKNQNAKTTVTVMIFASLFTAFALQLMMIKNTFTFD